MSPGSFCWTIFKSCESSSLKLLLQSDPLYTSRMSKFSERIKEALSPPDPALLRAGAGGEQLVAKTRLLFWLFVWLSPLSVTLLKGSETPIPMLYSFYGSSVGVTLSLFVLLNQRNRLPRPTAGFWSGGIDVSIVTITYFSISLAGHADSVFNSQSGWCVYILLVMTSTLRFSVRIVLFVGILAILQYVPLVTISAQMMEPPPADYNVLLQTTKIMLMIAATAIGVGVVNRTRGLVRASGFDDLTGLATRAYFNERFASEISRAEREGSQLSLVMFDIDHFKRFNDRYGHHHGDVALRSVASAIVQEKRPSDFVSRWGGEELAMIITGANAEQAKQAAQRILNAVRETDFHCDGEVCNVTLSAGISEYGTDGDDLTQLFAAADRRLYRAKEAGRDQVMAHG